MAENRKPGWQLRVILLLTLVMTLAVLPCTVYADDEITDEIETTDEIAEPVIQPEFDAIAEDLFLDHEEIQGLEPVDEGTIEVFYEDDEVFIEETVETDELEEM